MYQVSIWSTDDTDKAVACLQAQECEYVIVVHSGAHRYVLGVSWY